LSADKAVKRINCARQLGIRPSGGKVCPYEQAEEDPR